ncbi:PREDICTED: protein Shroom1 [Dipodomys ordii]|uniref:Protein Shroom1 n=1 Tax=Dipodomys ordii TaxID=10020 RepID=A0A1S3GCC6_DIPOR|nr:PREDICTED: protein Shroom1 [Dipodomys ordii]
MEALGPGGLGSGGDRASPASSTGSLDFGQLSTRADSAYSSFSTASGDPEPRTPSPATDLLPCLDWGSVRVAWGGSAPVTPDPTVRPPRSRPAVATRGGPRRSPETRGPPGTFSRQATPMLCALAAEAEAQARAQAAEPPSPPASRAAYRQRLAHAPDQQYGNGLSHRASQATVPEERTLHPCLQIVGADDCWQQVDASVGVFRPTSCSPPEAANGDTPTIDPPGLLTSDPPATAENGPLKPSPVDVLEPSGNDLPGSPHHTTLARGPGQPPWPSPHLQELVQELARLDPSLSDTFTSQSSPEPPLGLLDGLIPLPEIWAAMRPACWEEVGEETEGASEPGCHAGNLTRHLPASQEATRQENSTSSFVPDQPCGLGLGPESKYNIQAKKVELASLLQKMLVDLQAEQERLHGLARAWARRREDLEAAVSRTCAPRDLERFTRFLADLERVLGLLLLLGCRLTRVHCAMDRLGSAGAPEERASLLQRLRLLQRQQEDAKELKDHVARRERALREVLGQALPTEELSAYGALLAGKAAILAQQRSLDECVRLLQDQLDAIRIDLGHRPLCPRPSWPPGSCLSPAKPFPASPV